MRGPTTSAPAAAAKPPTMWTAPEPAKSMAPRWKRRGPLAWRGERGRRRGRRARPAPPRPRRPLAVSRLLTRFMLAHPAVDHTECTTMG